MKFEVTTSVLAGLLMTDPAMAQAAALRKKKERIMDSQAMEDIQESHHVHERAKSQEETYQNVTHFASSNRQKKEEQPVTGHDHLEEVNVSNNEEQIVHVVGGARARRRPGHGHGLYANVADMPDDFWEGDDFGYYDDEEELELDMASSLDYTPDVGILAAGNETAAAALDRKLQKKNCFQLLPAVLRRRIKGKPPPKFTKPFCDPNFGFLSYWSIQNYANFFFGGYCECAQVCKRKRVFRCCAQGCLACNKGVDGQASEKGKPAFQRCGQWTKANFGG